MGWIASPGTKAMSNNRLIELLQHLVESLGYEFVGLEYQKNP